MKVVIVEDLPDQAAAAEFLVRMQSGFEPVSYGTIAQAREALKEVAEPFIVLLDHDLGDPEEPGYSFCAWLREEHPLGLLLPIVYLTGRETPEGYYARQHTEPLVHPTVYLNKIDMTSMLPALLIRCARQFDLVYRWNERQGALRALRAIANAQFPLTDESEA